MLGQGAGIGQGEGTQSPGIDLPENLVAHYLLNNNADDCHGTFDGTVYGEIDFKGDVASFDGDGEYIECYDYSFNATLTFSIWARKTAEQQYSYALGWGYYNGGSDATQISILMGYADEKIRLRIKEDDTTKDYIHSETIGLDDWYHIVVTYDTVSNKFKGYINGNLVSTETLSIESATRMLRIGAGPDTLNNSHCMRGNLSNIRIYNDAKDQAFIDELYAEGYYPKPLPFPTTDGLTAHYPLTGTAEDSTGNYDGGYGTGYELDSNFGGVSSFDDVNNLMTIPTAALNSSLNNSISLWVKLDAFPLNKGYTILEKYSGDSGWNYGFPSIGVIVDPFRLSFTGRDGSGTVCAFLIDENPQLNTWYHIVVTYDESLSTHGSMRCYLDDNFIIEQVANRIPPNFSYPIRIADSQDNWQNDILDGKIKDIRFYNKALTQQEITDIYNYEKNFRSIDIDDGLVAYYPLKQNSLDNYYNEFDGVDVGSVVYDGNKAELDGSNFIQNIQNPIMVNKSFSVSIWADSDKGALLNRGKVTTGGKDYGIKMSIGEGKLKLYRSVGTASDFLAEVDTVVDTGMRHYVATYNIIDGVVSLYENGVLLSTQSLSTADITYYGNYDRGYFDIGVQDWVDDTTDPLIGSIANARIYNKVITHKQIQVIYNTEKGEFQ